MCPRFSLRLFLIAFTVLAILLGGVTRWVQRIKSQTRQHQAAVRFLQENACDIKEDGQEAEKRKPLTAYHSFVRNWVDENYGEQAGYVRFNGIRRSDRALRELTQLEHVHGVDSLDLDLIEFDPRVFERLAVHRNLTELSLSFEHYQNDAKDDWSSLSSLTSLRIGGPLRDEAFVTVASLCNLKTLRIDATNLWLKAAAAASRLENLEEITISGDVNDGAWLQASLALPKLKSVTLWETRIRESALPAFKSAGTVKEIRLWGHVSLPQNFFSALGQTRQLESLTCHISVEEKFPDIKRIAEIRGLKELDLSIAKLNRQDLLSLRGLKSLRSLKFTGHIDKTTLREFLSDIPACQIEMESSHRFSMLPDGWRCTLVRGKLACDESHDCRLRCEPLRIQPPRKAIGHRVNAAVMDRCNISLRNRPLHRMSK